MKKELKEQQEKAFTKCMSSVSSAGTGAKFMPCWHGKLHAVDPSDFEGLALSQ